MTSTFEILVYGSTLFALSILAGYIVGKLSQRKESRLVPSFVGASVRLRTNGSMYRTRFLREEREAFVFAAPLSRDSFVPLRVGEPVTLEIASSSGVALIRSEIVGRNADSHEFSVKRPLSLSVVDRRDGARFVPDEPLNIRLESTVSQLVNISEKGAKVQSTFEVQKGVRVHLFVPWQDLPVAGWVISAERHGQQFEYRIIFEELVPIPHSLTLGRR